MVITEKTLIYKQCLKLVNEQEEKREIYRKIYKKTSLYFWKNEYKYFTKNYIQKRHIIKVLTYKLPIEIYFKITKYLNLNNLKD